VVGAAAMFSDAFGTEEQWIHQMILDNMDPNNYNNNVFKESYLSTMYRIVSKSARLSSILST